MERKWKKNEGGFILNSFEEEYLRIMKKKNPEHFEIAIFLMSKMNRTNRDLKILIYLLISFLFPIYVLLFQFILKK